MITFLCLIMMVTFMGMILRGVERYLLRDALTESKKFTEQLNAGVDDPEFGIYQGYVCPVWDHNRIERDLSGTDFLHCDNKDCPACYEHGKCAVAECNDPGTMEWFTTYRHEYSEWLCGGHYNIRAGERELFNKRKKELADSRKKVELIRDRVVGGHYVTIPAEVPDHAHADFKPAVRPGDCDQIMWKWMDTETGERMGLRQILPPEIAVGDYNKPRRLAPKPKHDVVDYIVKDKNGKTVGRYDNEWDAKVHAEVIAREEHKNQWKLRQRL